jgi:hypothetical protein
MKTSHDLFEAPDSLWAIVAIPNQGADGAAIEAFQFDFPRWGRYKSGSAAPFRRAIARLGALL